MKKFVTGKTTIVMLLLTVLLIAGGCGNQNSEKGQNSPAGQAQSTQQATGGDVSTGPVTYENYEKIKLGMTYDEVKKILGDGKMTDLGSSKLYSWDDMAREITVQTSEGKVEQKSQTLLGKTTAKVTEDQFNKIAKGMNFDQVVSILGTDYQEASLKKSVDTTRRFVYWVRADKKYITVTFEGDKVIDSMNGLK